MNLHLLKTRVYTASLIIIQIHGYLLLAANLEDFKSIAKKFVPEKLANQLADLASNSPVQYRQISESQEEPESYSEDDAERRGKQDSSEAIDTAKEASLAKINFEELVQKVKERIAKDLETSHKKTNIGQREERYKPKHYSQSEKLTKITRFVNDRRKKTTKSLRVPHLERQVKKPTIETQDDDMTFAKIPMKENDSYEDYVTPEKEQNLFESDVEKSDTPTTTFRQITDAEQETESPIEYEYSDKTEELKAKTEDLWYDYKQKNVTEDYEDTTPMVSKSTKKAKGTNIPKRDFYKMSSPDYAVKVPIVAEKYDFNEPIPEKDREPLDLKIKNFSPAIINGKVRIGKIGK